MEEQVGLLATTTPRGRVLILVASILLSLLTIAPQSVVPGIVVLAVFTIALLFVSRIIFDLELSVARRLVIERHYEVPVIEHKPLRIKVRIKNESRIPIPFLELIDKYPPLFKLLKHSNASVVTVPSKGMVIIEYLLRPVVGKHVFEGTELVLRDPAGLFSRKILVGDKDVVEVQPRLESIRRRTLLVIPTLRPGGTSLTKRRGIGMQFMDIREYVPGDEYRRIEWKATARTRRLMVKEFEQESSLEVMLVLDLAGSMSYGVVGSTKLEYSLRALASISEYLLGRGDYVGLAVSIGDEKLMLKPGRGPSQWRRIMKMLSSIRWPRPDMPSNLDRVLQEAVTKASRRGRNVYIIISDLESSQVNGLEVLHRIRSLRNEVIVISPYTPLFEVKGLKGLQAALYRLYLARSISDREKTIKALLARGIPVVTVGPDDMVEATLLRIEFIRQKLV